MVKRSVTSPISVVRQPSLSGRQMIAGLWLPADWFSKQQCERLILQHWRSYARAYRFEQGDLLYYAELVSVDCSQLDGWPLITEEGRLYSASLTSAEKQTITQADICLVYGSTPLLLSWQQATELDPACWFTLENYLLVECYHPEKTVVANSEILVPVESDVRQIFGSKIPPASDEQLHFLKQLRNTSQHSKVVAPSPDRLGFFLRLIIYLNLGIGIVLMGMLVLYLSRSESHELMIFPLLAIGIGCLFLLSKWRVRHLGSGIIRQVVQWFSPAVTESSISPRRQSLRTRVPFWRRWVSQLVIKSQLMNYFTRQQAKYIERYLQMFESGNIEEALKHAISLGGMGDKLHTPSLGGLKQRSSLSLSTWQNRSTSGISISDELEQYIRQVYRRSFEKLSREGQIDEAVFILAELLQAQDEALDYLEQHQRYQQAAELALVWEMPAEKIVRLYCLVGNWQSAVAVARRDNAFAQAVLLLEEKHPEQAQQLRLDWAETLADKGQWLEAIDVLWPLKKERYRAEQWLDWAEQSEGGLAARALVKRAILLPDTIESCQAAIEQLCYSPESYYQRYSAAQEVLKNRADHQKLSWLVAAMFNRLLADQMRSTALLTKKELNELLSLSHDSLLQSDIPSIQLFSHKQQPLMEAAHSLIWQILLPGKQPIYDAVILEPNRYLLALGEVGAVCVDQYGRIITHFSQPAYQIVLAESCQLALVLAKRSSLWRITRLDLTQRVSHDLGVLALEQFAKEFDGICWTVIKEDQIQVLDIERQFGVLWRVDNLPGRIVNFMVTRQEEQWLMCDSHGRAELWCYQLPQRRLISRELSTQFSAVDQLILDSEKGALEFSFQQEEEHYTLIVKNSNGYQLVAVKLPELSVENLMEISVIPSGEMVLIAIPGCQQWWIVKRYTSEVKGVLTWSVTMGEVRIQGDHWLFFDAEGRLGHIDTTTSQFIQFTV